MKGRHLATGLTLLKVKPAETRSPAPTSRVAAWGPWRARPDRVGVTGAAGMGPRALLSWPKSPWRQGFSCWYSGWEAAVAQPGRVRSLGRRTQASGPQAFQGRRAERAATKASVRQGRVLRARIPRAFLLPGSGMFQQRTALAQLLPELCPSWRLSSPPHPPPLPRKLVTRIFLQAGALLGNSWEGRARVRTNTLVLGSHAGLQTCSELGQEGPWRHLGATSRPRPSCSLIHFRGVLPTRTGPLSASEREEAGGVLGPGGGQSGERPGVCTQLSPEQEGREGPAPRSLRLAGVRAPVSVLTGVPQGGKAPAPPASPSLPSERGPAPSPLRLRGSAVETISHGSRALVPPATQVTQTLSQTP